MTNALKAGTAYFAIIFAVGFALGVVRALVFVPRFGEAAAVLIELPLILLASWIVCGWLVRSFAVVAATGPRLAMGGMAFILLMAAEFALGILFGRSVSEHGQHYLTLAGVFGLSGQLAFAAFPYLMLIATPRSSGRR